MESVENNPISTTTNIINDAVLVALATPASLATTTASSSSSIRPNFPTGDVRPLEKSTARQGFNLNEGVATSFYTASEPSSPSSSEDNDDDAAATDETSNYTYSDIGTPILVNPQQKQQSDSVVWLKYKQAYPRNTFMRQTFNDRVSELWQQLLDFFDRIGKWITQTINVAFSDSVGMYFAHTLVVLTGFFIGYSLVVADVPFYLSFCFLLIILNLCQSICKY